MSSVRKREWGRVVGYDDYGKAIREKHAWICIYRDLGGVRRLKTFDKKRDAEAFKAKTDVAIGEGTHVADSATVTVSEACDLWLQSCRQRNLEPSTLAQYGQHCELHIKPLLGATKLTKITVASVRAFADQLIEKGRSQAMRRAVLGSLSSIMADAMDRGVVARNIVRERSRRGSGAKKGDDGRRKLQVGVDIPTPHEIKLTVQSAKGLRPQVSVRTLATTGLRSSEFRGLRWQDVDLNKPELHVRVRADFNNIIGPPKSSAGTRTIPLIPSTARYLRLWKADCPKSDLDLVFPNGAGNIEYHQNILSRIWWQAQLDAGIVVKDDDGNEQPKYSGLHTLRHFFASWCINREVDGGLELPAKVVQERLGHGSITVTLDTYGHLFPRGNDAVKMRRADSALFGSTPRVRVKPARP